MKKIQWIENQSTNYLYKASSFHSAQLVLGGAIMNSKCIRKHIVLGALDTSTSESILIVSRATRREQVKRAFEYYFLMFRPHQCWHQAPESSNSFFLELAKDDRP